MRPEEYEAMRFDPVAFGRKFKKAALDFMEEHGAKTEEEQEFLWQTIMLPGIVQHGSMGERPPIKATTGEIA